MTQMFNVPQDKLVQRIAEELKKVEAINPPEWAAFVKTGAQKQRPPMEDEWWFKRTAAILRSIAVMGPIGVSKLRTRYGGRKRRGHKPPKFKKGSGSILRKALQQLEKAGFCKQTENNAKHKGRIITSKGMKIIERAACELLKNSRKPALQTSKPRIEAKEEKKGEEKKDTKHIKEKTEKAEHKEVEHKEKEVEHKENKETNIAKENINEEIAKQSEEQKKA